MNNEVWGHELPGDVILIVTFGAPGQGTDQSQSRDQYKHVEDRPGFRVKNVVGQRTVYK